MIVDYTLSCEKELIANAEKAARSKGTDLSTATLEFWSSLAGGQSAPKLSEKALKGAMGAAVRCEVDGETGAVVLPADWEDFLDD